MLFLYVIMNGYDLSRNFWNWAFDNPEKISPNHAAIFFFAVEHCNRLGGKEKFGFPSQMTMDAIGIRKHQTYIKYFNELVDYGFFKMIEKSRNQYSANIISLVYAMPKKDKALDKAIIKHRAKQTESNGQSMDSIVKPINKGNNKPINKEYIEPIFLDVWNKWLDYKKELNNCYKTSKGEKTAYNKLIKLANNNIATAELIINQSIENEWKGLFEFKGCVKTVPSEAFNLTEYLIPNDDSFGLEQGELIKRCKEGFYKKAF